LEGNRGLAGVKVMVGEGDDVGGGSLGMAGESSPGFLRLKGTNPTLRLVILGPTMVNPNDYHPHSPSDPARGGQERHHEQKAKGFL